MTRTFHLRPIKGALVTMYTSVLASPPQGEDQLFLDRYKVNIHISIFILIEVTI